MRVGTGLVIAALLASATACGGEQAQRPDTVKVRGTVTVYGGSPDVLTTENNECTNTGGYSDINQGARVTLRSDSGKTLGVDSLSLGSPTDDLGCKFGFLFTDVPSEGFYGIKIAGRDEFTIKRSEAEDVRLTLGS